MPLDTAEIHTLPELIEALNVLRGTRTNAELTRQARALASHNGVMPELPRSTLSDLLRGAAVPSRDTMVTFLRVCGLTTEADRQPWLQAWDRVSAAHQRRPAGAVRVRRARPRLLGVHASIQVERQVTDLPVYVPRDLDADLRAMIEVAAAEGGFVLLLGGSSVGKTRTLFEAVRAILPEWWLLYPADTAAIRAFAAAPTPRTVVWLDELQQYLKSSDGLSAGIVRDLITAGTVLVATMWPREYTARIAGPVSGKSDIFANDRSLLRLAQVVEVPESFSRAERHRGATVAAADGRIRVALDTSDAGVTQVLAAGPELVRHWEQAPEEQCYGKALITAALDARRVGAHHPVTVEFLSVAAPAYLTPAQRATAPSDWLDQALAYAVTPVRGAAACLAPVAAGMGGIGGYASADYLHQHAILSRRLAPLPALLWDAIVDHHHPGDATRIGYHAERRGRSDTAMVMYGAAACRGNTLGMRQLAHMLLDQKNNEEAEQWLRAAVDADDQHALVELAEIRSGNGANDEAEALFRRAVAREDPYTHSRFAFWLHGRNRIDEAFHWMRLAADLGDANAACNMGFILLKQGDLEGGEIWTRRAAASGHVGAMRNLGKLLLDQGDRDAAHEVFRQAAEKAYGDEMAALERPRWNGEAADGGLSYAMFAHAEALIEVGAVEEATVWLRRGAETGDGRAAATLAKQFLELGDRREYRQWMSRAARLSRTNLRNNETSIRRAYGTDGISQHVEILEEYATVLAERGDNAEAERWRLLADQYSVAEPG